jgi:hypothetical protein
MRATAQLKTLRFNSIAKKPTTRKNIAKNKKADLNNFKVVFMQFSFNMIYLSYHMLKIDKRVEFIEVVELKSPDP